MRRKLEERGWEEGGENVNTPRWVRRKLEVRGWRDKKKAAEWLLRLVALFDQAGSLALPTAQEI